jgi:hypothetical protein
MLPMIVELGASGLLALGWAGGPKESMLRALLWAGAVLAVLTWAVTFFVSVPLHGRLSHRFDRAAIRALVATNWWRTALWSAHALVMLEVLRRLLTAPARPTG